MNLPDVLYMIILLIYIPFNPRFIFRREYRKLLKGRFAPGIDTQGQKCIWVHAVSVGEVKSLVNFVSRLKERTNRRMVLSVTTPSGFRIARDIFSGIDVINGPLDLSFVVRRFIRRIDPSLIILNELEIWPNWISIAAKAGIPVTVINGRMSDRAFSRYKRFSFFLRRYFRKIALFLIQEDRFRDRFAALGVDGGSVRVCGNIKADEALEAVRGLPVRDEIFRQAGLEDNGTKIALFASTHRQDEDRFIPVLKQIAKKYRVIIAPRHMNRVGEIVMRLRSEGIDAAVWSAGLQGGEAVIVFDAMGYLTRLMSISDIIFMGGSFDPATGGHNLYEPAAQGKRMIGGPCYDHFRSIGDELIREGAYDIVRSSNEILESFHGSGEKEMNTAGMKARECVLKNAGAVDCSVNEVLKLIN